MEVKKIAFIVVAIATVGGVAYYLNKRNKANSQVATETKSSFLNKKVTLKELSKIASNPTRVVQDALPIVSSDYQDVNSRNVNI